MASLIQTLAEEIRERTTGDKLFYRRMPPIFELKVPARVAFGITSFLFPLPMPPKSISIDYPFSVEITPTLDGGVVTERNGIITVDINIRGTMGQRPKLYTGDFFGLLGAGVDHKASDHDVVNRSMAGMRLSGHRYLLHLKHSVFGMYSDLVQDPSLAEDTQLILHIPKDDEHWVVEPRSFLIPREARQAGFEFEIQLTGITRALALIEVSADRSILQSISDGIATVRSAIGLVRGAIQDLQNLRSELEGFVRSITSLIDDVSSIVSEAQDFVDGVTEFLPTTRDRILAAGDNLENLLLLHGDKFSDGTAHSLLEMSDGLHEIAVQASLFAPPRNAISQDAFRRGLGLLTSTSQSALASAAAAPGPNSEAAWRSSGLLPGDAARDARARAQLEEFKQYRSAFEILLNEGDTLESLAGLHLGDPRLWRHIAILNALADPYISDAGFPNTLRPGQKCLIPSTAPAIQTRNAATLGSDTNATPEIRNLGVDFKIQVDRDSGLEDWVVDTGGGGVDLAVAKGVECLSQDLAARVGAPLGSDPLYPKVGLASVIGLGSKDLELDAYAQVIRSNIETDPRVSNAANITILQDTVDKLGVSADVRVRGLHDSVAIQASVPAPQKD